jgi:hypothetical protein
VGYIFCVNTVLKNRPVQATTLVGIAEVANMAILVELVLQIYEKRN